MFRNEDGHAVQSRTVPMMEEIGEEDLLKPDEEIKKMMKTGRKPTVETTTSSGMSNGDGAMAYRLKCLLAVTVVNPVMALEMVTQPKDAGERNGNGGYTSIYVTIFVTIVVAIMVEKLVSYGVGYIRDYLKEKLLKNDMVKIKEEPMEPSMRKRKVMVDEHETVAMEVDRCSLFDKVEEENREASLEELHRRLDEKEEYVEVMTKSRDHFKDLAYKNQQTYMEWQDKEAKALNKYGEACEDLAAANDRIEYLNNKIKSQQETIQLNATRFGNQTTKLNEKEKELGRLQERYDTMIQRLHDGTDSVAEVNRENVTIKDAMKNLQKELDEKVVEINNQKTEIQELNNKLMEKQALLVSAMVERDQKNQRLEHAVQRNRDLQQELNVAKAPEKVCFTPHGTVYHRLGCKHVERSATHEMRKCKDCLP